MIKAAYRTRQQELLISYLEGTCGKHFTAEDVKKHFEEQNIALGTATIYRQLEKLVAEGKILKYFVDEHSAACFEYIGGTCQTDEQHFHLKCESCGTLFHLECEELSEITTHLFKEHGFELNPFRTVLYGTCKNCRKS